MNKEMIYLPVKDFVQANLDFNIASSRKDSEYDFNFTRWKTMIFSSQKLKFVLKYTQSILHWLSKNIDVSNFKVSIDTTTVDRFNFSLYEFENHIFNCSLFTNFYLIPEEEWADKIFETHISKFDFVNSELVYSDESTFWKGEEGFEKFVNMLYAILKEPYKFETKAPIQWQVDFKDKKLSNSQIRMQIASLVQTGIRPEDPYLTMEQAEEIEHGANPDDIARKAQQESRSKKVINPLWDEAVELERLYSDMNYAMNKMRGNEIKKKKKKR